MIFIKNIKKMRLFFALFLAFFIALSPLNVFAVQPVYDEDFYSGNNILFYNPDDNGATSCGTNQVITETSTLTVNKSATVDAIYKYLTTTPLTTNGNKPLTAVQASGIMGNFYGESSLNPSAIENTQATAKGHGLAQWTAGRWTNLQNFASQKGKQWDDTTTQLDYLKSELEGSEKGILTDAEFINANAPSVAATRFRIIFERANVALAHDDKRIGAAISIYNQYSGSTADAGCTSSSGVAIGNLVETAIGFALTSPASNGMTSKSQARDTYQVGKMKYNPGVDWTDCGGFIATAMYASGVDLNYPKVSVTAQVAYVKSHPEKYLFNAKPTLAGLQPGDILYTSGHTTMYTGKDQYPSVDASLGERVPSVRTAGSATYMIGDGAVSARMIK